jgi:hypothetical protein
VYPPRLARTAVGLLRAAAVLGFALLLGEGFGKVPEPKAPVVVRRETLPERLGLATHRDKSTIVLVVDPNAPNAELALKQLRQTLDGRASTCVAHVLFVVGEQDFVPHALWTTAVAMRGVHVLRDTSGATALKLQARPGTTLLYGVDRRLVFRGGSTLELPAILDRPATNRGAPPARKDSARRRPGPLDDGIDPDSTRSRRL